MDNSEQVLISAVLRTGDYQALAKWGLIPTMFHSYKDEYIWLERFIQRKGRTPSPRAFKNKWPEFVFKRETDVDYWCEQVKEDHKRQAFVDLASDALDLVGDNPDKALAVMAQGLQQIETVSRGVDADFDLFGNWEEIYGIAKERVIRNRTTGMVGVPTGFPTLDEVTGGFQPGWFSVIAARTGIGKTSMSLRMAWAAAMAGKRVLYFSLEQSRFQIATRLHAFGSREYLGAAFDPSEITRGTVDLMAYRKFLRDLKQRMSSTYFNINDSSRGIVSPATVASTIQTFQPDITFIDYLTLLHRENFDWQGAAQLSNELQATSQRYMTPITALSQINRSGAGKEPPDVEHLSQTDALGHDADMVITLSKKSPHLMKGKLAKFRDGPTGVTWMNHFDLANGIFEEVGPEEAEKILEDDQLVD